MNQKKRNFSLLIYLQVMLFGLILVFSPCSVRNSIQDSLGLEKTGVTNKSKSINNFEELCSTLNIESSTGQHTDLNNTTPEFPPFLNPIDYRDQREWNFNKDFPLNLYNAPCTIKNKTPLYLLHQRMQVDPLTA